MPVITPLSSSVAHAVDSSSAQTQAQCEQIAKWLGTLDATQANINDTSSVCDPLSHHTCKISCQVNIYGIVQGVGFRPHVWQLANLFGVSGQISNNAQGVEINCAGSPAQLNDFLQRICQQPPPNARIERLELKRLPSTAEITSAEQEADHFTIAQSSMPGSTTHPQQVATTIGADKVTCAACKAEIFDPNSRRYDYAFTNCTHCGPRLSITRQLPYDRAQTSMASFNMCNDCQQEYQSPADRRFHAQPNACQDCGPSLWLTDDTGMLITQQNSLAAAEQALRAGKIVAIKGLGGFQLAVDACQAAAVARLRKRKSRPHKPFALMARDMTVIEQYCSVNAAESALLRSSAGPIVTLQRATSATLLPGIAPDQATLGFMLPSTPLHHLLLQHWSTPMVMTSANLSGQPQCTDNQQAINDLEGIADYLLMHDRAVVQRVDDSVAQVINGQPQLLRRARGYAPEPLALPPGFNITDRILAMGGDLKHTFCLLSSSGALLSQHIGDLYDPSTLDDMQQCLTLYRQMQPGPIAAVAMDQHPNYRSRRIGEQLVERLTKQHAFAETAENTKQPTPPQRLYIQHHHAHAAACMGDNQWPLHGGKVVAIALDGLGFAEEQNNPPTTRTSQPSKAPQKAQQHQLWGGELLLADYQRSQVAARLQPTALPGGEQAMQQPWRNLFAQLYQHLDWDLLCKRYGHLPLMKCLQQQPLDTLAHMIDKGINTPLSSSCARLFDAVAAAVGICASDSISYEGQAAMQLQSQLSADTKHSADWLRVNGYPFKLQHCAPSAIWQLHAAPMWLALLEDLNQNHTPVYIAARFHVGLAQAFADIAIKLAAEHNCQAVALCGGVFQNAALHSVTEQRLLDADVKVLSHKQVPTNDGGLAFGQALISAARMQADLALPQPEAQSAFQPAAASPHLSGVASCV